jgi:hypothetical protein
MAWQRQRPGSRSRGARHPIHRVGNSHRTERHTNGVSPDGDADHSCRIDRPKITLGAGIS